MEEGKSADLGEFPTPQRSARCDKAGVDLVIYEYVSGAEARKAVSAAGALPGGCVAYVIEGAVYAEADEPALRELAGDFGLAVQQLGTCR